MSRHHSAVLGLLVPNKCFSGTHVIFHVSHSKSNQLQTYTYIQDCETDPFNYMSTVYACDALPHDIRLCDGLGSSRYHLFNCNTNLQWLHNESQMGTAPSTLSSRLAGIQEHVLYNIPVFPMLDSLQTIW